MTPTALGVCPTCEEPGTVAAPCARAACARRGYHCIPPEHIPDAEHVDRYIGQKWGEYLLVRKLGAGGVGAVYLALQCPLMMETALKLFSDTSSSPALAGRFAAEATALARLRHPNIVRLLQFGHHGDRPYLVMEYVPGATTLADAMTQPLDRAVIVDLLTQTAAGLAAAHHCDVVHRDIKPANIMLQTLPGQAGWYVRIVDFGLAKFVDDGGSTQLLAGTPTYMAPEQITKRGIGPWTDWYALGAIAFELLTGRRPFPRASVERTMLLKVDPTYDPIAQVHDLALPPSLIGFFRRVLAHDTAARPATGEAFVAELRAALADAPELAPTTQVPVVDPSGAPTVTSTDMRGEAWPPEPPTPAPVAGSGGRWRLPVAAVALGLAVGLGWLALGPPAPEPVELTAAAIADATLFAPVTLDAAADAAMPDAVADGAPDVALDVAPDVAPDMTPDVAPARPAPTRRRGTSRRPRPPPPKPDLGMEVFIPPEQP